MSRYNKTFALTAIAGAVFALSACGGTSSGWNYNPSAGYGQPKYAAAVDVSDLYNRTEKDAKKQLRARRFTQVGEARSGYFNSSWWLNRYTNQCFQLKAAGGKVAALDSTSAGDCRALANPKAKEQQKFAGLPQAAAAACFRRFGEPGQQSIKKVTPLKPGFWEVIITGKKGRQVACTVDRNGSILGWVPK
jgi:hypothetical protein